MQFAEAARKRSDTTTTDLATPPATLVLSAAEADVVSIE